MLISADTGFPLCGIAAITERGCQSGRADRTTEDMDYATDQGMCDSAKRRIAANEPARAGNTF
jgi:hypothetical protein